MDKRLSPTLLGPGSHDGYLLQRYLLGTDWRITPQFRVFAELDSSLEEGRDGGPRAAIDQSKLNFNQVFAVLFLWGGTDHADNEDENVAKLTLVKKNQSEGI